MTLRQKQQLKQTQRLSPLQLQVIKLIELNSIELEDKIKQELEENPALDEAIAKDGVNDDDKHEEDEYAELLSQEEIITGDYTSEEEMPDYRLNIGVNNNFDQPITDFAFSDNTLHQSLLDQINLRNLSNKEKQIAE